MNFTEIIAKQRQVDPQLLTVAKAPKLDWAALDAEVTATFNYLFIDHPNARVGVLYDVDVDGLYAGYTAENALIRAGLSSKQVFNFMNGNKVHGFSQAVADWAVSTKLDLLFIVDAGSSDTRAIHEQLPNTKVVILDHHDYDRNSLISADQLTVLNIGDYPELPALSGCGVTFRFFEQLLGKLGVTSTCYEPYVGITVLSDVCSMLVPENRYYVQQAYANIQGNNFLKAFTFWGSQKTFYSFGVIPYLNALVRLGKADRAMHIVNHMDAKYTTLATEVKAVKAEQRALVDTLGELGTIYDNGNGVVIHLRKDAPDYNVINGLYANKLLNKYGCSALVLNYNSATGQYNGSFRGRNFENDKLTALGATCIGHAKACGVYFDQAVFDRISGAAQIAPLFTPKRADFKVNSADLTSQTLKTMATFNEMCSGDWETVLLCLTDDPATYQLNKSWGMTYRTQLANGMEVTQFDGQALDGSLIVEPVLDKRNGVQLIRAF